MLLHKIREQSVVTQAIWVLLALAVPVALAEGRWSLGFVALVTLALSFVPMLAEERFGIELPVRFVAAIVIFIFATIFLGEAMDFYNRY